MIRCYDVLDKIVNMISRFRGQHLLFLISIMGKIFCESLS